jgi:hypothetical protein
MVHDLSPCPIEGGDTFWVSGAGPWSFPKAAFLMSSSPAARDEMLLLGPRDTQYATGGGRRQAPVQSGTKPCYQYGGWWLVESAS